MTANPALDVAIRQARHLVFAFDGSIRTVNPGNPVDSSTPTVPYISDVLSACYESGRSASVISASPLADVSAYLDTHNLLTQVAIVAASINQVLKALEASAVDCMLVTCSPADVVTARAVGVNSIGYARTLDDEAFLINAKAAVSLFSMVDLALSLRAYRLDL